MFEEAKLGEVVMLDEVTPREVMKKPLKLL